MHELRACAQSQPPGPVPTVCPVLLCPLAEAQEFKAKFEEAQAANKEVIGGGDEDEEAGEEKEESSAAAADPEVDALADEVASKATVAGESTAEEAS